VSIRVKNYIFLASMSPYLPQWNKGILTRMDTDEPDGQATMIGLGAKYYSTLLTDDASGIERTMLNGTPERAEYLRSA
jgi:hypothetical protein